MGRFKPGHKRLGGRKKGTPNKITAQVLEKTRELGIDPLEILLLFAAGDWKALGYEEDRFLSGSNEHGAYCKWTIDPAVRARCAAEACQYLYPKRKAIEHSGQMDVTNTVTVAKSDLEERIKQIKGE
jgi:hypothetical protein